MDFRLQKVFEIKFRGEILLQLSRIWVPSMMSVNWTSLTIQVMSLARWTRIQLTFLFHQWKYQLIYCFKRYTWLSDDFGPSLGKRICSTSKGSPKVSNWSCWCPALDLLNENWWVKLGQNWWSKDFYLSVSKTQNVLALVLVR